MSRVVVMAVAVIEGWVRCYTAAAPPGVRVARRGELAADIHEHLADLAERRVGGRRAAWEILRRALLGVPDDLIWALRPDRLEETMSVRIRTLALAGWATALILGVLDLMGAIAGLQHGWRELGQHWWSTLAVAGVAVAFVGLALAIAAVLRPARR